MRIALLGDIAFYGKYSVENNENIFDYFKDVSDYLSDFDLVIGNLETPFVDSSAKPYGFKSAYIKAEPQNIELLKYLNIGCVNLANNHTYDYGSSSFKYTKELLKQHDIQYYGNKTESLIINIKGESIALNGYCCYSTNPLGLSRKSQKGINPLTYRAILDQIQQNNQRGILPIMAVHCGQEHVNYPNYDHILLARELAKCGSFVFYGHHPHVLQGVEFVNKSLMAYSLGNFCFDDVYTSKSQLPLIKQRKVNKESVILEITIKNGNIISNKQTPIYSGETKMEIGDMGILNKLDEYSKGLYDSRISYIEKRDKKVQNYISSRKSKRDFKWYLKRMNITSFFILTNAFLNKKRYQKSLKEIL